MPAFLVVDDSPTIRRMVKASLSVVPGATFAEAGTGLEAIELLALGPVCMMVLDLNMPDMHGIDVLTSCKLDEVTALRWWRSSSMS